MTTRDPSATMSKIAAETGIGRATLYKYFPDVESVLIAWHERQVGAHLEQLAGIRDQAGAELAAYCMHALTAADTLRTAAAVRRLVTVTLAGLRPPR